jgi:serpin B
MYRPHLDFALALDRLLPAQGNLVWSPLSVASALTLVAAGARGGTRAELAAALAPGGGLDELAEHLRGAASAPGAEIAVATMLWMALDLDFETDYQSAVLGWPGGVLHHADFRRDPGGCRSMINDEVAKTTRQLIKDLLRPGTLKPDTAAVVVNALYLRIAWRMPFEAGATTPRPFHAPSGTRPVPTMRQRERMTYAAAGGWRMVTLPAGGPVAVDVLLPDTPGGAGAPAGPDPDTLAALHAAGRSVTVDLALPRFRVEAGADLNEPLARLGIRTAFAAAADFSGITRSRPVRIDEVVHKAVLTVDEQGLEGAAATAVAMRVVSMDLEPPVAVHVDRPFLMVVRHAPTGAIYFLARVGEP